MVKHKLLISEDQLILRAGLRALLSREPDLEVVGETGGGRETLQAAAALAPDLVMMDLPHPGAMGETITAIRAAQPLTRILILTQEQQPEGVCEALRAGANGCILKDASDGELVAAVRHVLAGKLFLSPRIAEKVIHALVLAEKGGGARRQLDLLTSREREILKRVAEGCTNRHIAAQLRLSVKTVEKHRSNLMRKLDLHNASALTTFAIGQGLVGAGEG